MIEEDEELAAIGALGALAEAARCAPPPDGIIMQLLVCWTCNAICDA